MANAEATQDFVPIQEVRDGIVVLSDGSLRAVLMASSTNFALKSGDEQQAILAQFQDFLNALDFSVQFFVQSRNLDIRPYIAQLEDRYKEQTAELLKIQTREYIEFVKSFTRSANIMSKNFFVVVPYTPPHLSTGNNPVEKLKGLIGLGDTADKAQEEGVERDFEEQRAQLEQRIEVVRQGLSRTSVRAAKLETDEVIELFSNLFNPGELEKPMTEKQKEQAQEAE